MGSSHHIWKPCAFIVHFSSQCESSVTEFRRRLRIVLFAQSFGFKASKIPIFPIRLYLPHSFQQPLFQFFWLNNCKPYQCHVVNQDSLLWLVMCATFTQFSFSPGWLSCSHVSLLVRMSFFFFFGSLIPLFIWVRINIFMDVPRSPLTCTSQLNIFAGQVLLSCPSSFP